MICHPSILRSRVAARFPATAKSVALIQSSASFSSLQGSSTTTSWKRGRRLDRELAALVCPTALLVSSSSRWQQRRRFGPRCTSTRRAATGGSERPKFRYTFRRETEALRADAIKQMIDAGIDHDEAKASVRWLWEAAVKRDDPEDVKQSLQETCFAEYVRRRCNREPVQYILGSWPFHTLPCELILRPPVLIPRPETEELVDHVIASYAPDHPSWILDVGCGSGAIIISLLNEFPFARGVALDVSPVACELTMENARRAGVDTRLDVVNASIQDWSGPAHGNRFDLLVSNPPYIPSRELNELDPEVRCFEDATALDGGKDGLDIVRHLLRQVPSICKPGARIFMELHFTHPNIFDLASEASLPCSEDEESITAGLLHFDLYKSNVRYVDSFTDYSGHERFVELRVRGESSEQAAKKQTCHGYALAAAAL